MNRRMKQTHCAQKEYITNKLIRKNSVLLKQAANRNMFCLVHFSKIGLMKLSNMPFMSEPTPLGACTSGWAVVRGARTAASSRRYWKRYMIRGRLYFRMVWCCGEFLAYQIKGEKLERVSAELAVTLMIETFGKAR